MRSKTYSGLLLRPHAAAIGALIREHGCRSVLDVGCGKGEQYRWVSPGPPHSAVPSGLTLEQFWGVEVTKYDPAVPAYVAEPRGTFDAVLCTHVLGSVPTVDLPWFIDRLYGWASRVVYVAEKLGPVKKRVLDDVPGLPRGYQRADWLRVLDRPAGRGLHVVLSTTGDESGTIREQVRIR